MHSNIINTQMLRLEENGMPQEGKKWCQASFYICILFWVLSLIAACGGGGDGGTPSQNSADTTRPIVVSTNPTDGATGVSRSLTSISVTFSEGMGGQYSIGETPNWATSNSTPVNWNSTKTIVTWGRDDADLLPANTTINVIINETGYQSNWFRDSVGNILNPSPYTFSFTTASSSVSLPTTPTGFAVTAASSSQINLSWNASTGATSYKIYKSGTYLKTVTTTSTSDTALSSSTNYCYYVIANNSAGDSVQTSQLCANTQASSVKENLLLIFKGSGIITNIETRQTMTLTEEEKLNILIIPEGYTEADLASGAFDADVIHWINDTKLVEPLASFQNAFNILQYNIASSEHVLLSDTRKADTAFAVPVWRDGSIRDELEDTAALVWKTATDLELIKPLYYPSGGKTHYINKNLVVVVLVFDPTSGASGFSGLTRRLINPYNINQRISTSFARDATHEFLHAFAMLSDEYLEDTSGKLGVPNALAVSASTVSNVVDDSSRGTVPWQHLIAGGTINPGTAQLIGAFGNANNGYHPEAKCLMNGTHDNAHYYGGDGYLRTVERLCNWCREITGFRLLERIDIFSTPASDFSTWINKYRANFYTLYPFNIPEEDLPLANSRGTVIPSVWW
jgi:hypothetical protein